MLEAIVALAIVALVCVGVLGAYGSALRADVTAANRLPLAALAVERVAAVDLDAGDLSRLPDSLSHGEFTSPYVGVTWQIETRSVLEAQGLFDVIVQIHDGRDAFTLQTRRYRAPLVIAGARP
jgi:hypothetical protein